MPIKYEDLATQLPKMRFIHLTSEELDNHVFNNLDELDGYRITAHLFMCHICGLRLKAMLRDYGLEPSPDEED